MRSLPVPNDSQVTCMDYCSVSSISFSLFIKNYCSCCGIMSVMLKKKVSVANL